MSLIVLVVEDEVLIQEFIEVGLGEGGYAVEKAYRGDEAMDLLDANNHYRALITDINLGSTVTGWEVARHARERFPTLPVIYVTTVSAGEWSAQGVPHSVLITKPFAPAQLVTALSQLLNAETVETAQVTVARTPSDK